LFDLEQESFYRLEGVLQDFFERSNLQSLYSMESGDIKSARLFSEDKTPAFCDLLLEIEKTGIVSINWFYYDIVYQIR
jgi:hypothetical protein